MSTGPRSEEQVREEGLRALVERLGRADTMRFIQQFIGRGDYTAERGAWLDALTIDDVVRSIEARRNAAGSGSDAA